MSLRDRRLLARLSVVLGVLAIIAVACGSSDNGGKASTTTSGATGGVPKGGSLTFGLEEEPDCLTPIKIRASSSGWQFLNLESRISNPFTVPRVY